MAKTQSPPHHNSVFVLVYLCHLLSSTITQLASDMAPPITMTQTLEGLLAIVVMEWSHLPVTESGMVLTWRR